MSDDDAEDEACPICGQPYDHEREESVRDEATLRTDATACKTPPLAGTQMVYVHLDGSQVVSRVVREPDDDEASGLGRLFT